MCKMNNCEHVNLLIFDNQSVKLWKLNIKISTEILGLKT